MTRASLCPLLCTVPHPEIIKSFYLVYSRRANANMRIFLLNKFCFPIMRHILGDEGQSLGGSYMVFHWQPDLSKWPSNSGCSRFLITTIPTTAYVYNGDINMTLQCAGQHIASCLTGFTLAVTNPQGCKVYFLKYIMFFKFFVLITDSRGLSPSLKEQTKGVISRPWRKIQKFGWFLQILGT